MKPLLTGQKSPGLALLSKSHLIQLDLQRVIELTISRMAENATGTKVPKEEGEEQPFILSDRIFVRYKEKMVKIMISDIFVQGGRLELKPHLYE